MKCTNDISLLHNISHWQAYTLLYKPVKKFNIRENLCKQYNLILLTNLYIFKHKKYNYILVYFVNVINKHNNKLTWNV